MSSPHVGTTAWGSSWPPGRRLPGNGLPARSRSGGFGSTWWGRSFTEAVEAAAGAGRIQRGRTYARAGQVMSLDLATGAARGLVQGSRNEPYAVELTFTRWSHQQREALVAAVAAEVAVLSAVLAGVLPEALDRLCASVGIPLFPSSADDVRFSCTCPDLTPVCKHAAALAYLLAEAVDDDPFAVLTLRGTSRQQLLAEVVAASSGTASPGAEPGAGSAPAARDLTSWCRRRAPLPQPPVPFGSDPERVKDPSDLLDASVLGPGEAVALDLTREAARLLRRDALRRLRRADG